MVDIPQSLWTSAIWGAAAAITAALIAGWLSRRVKISEFRQAWINDLRKDIADYIGAARKWWRAYERVNALTSSEERAAIEQQELFSVANDAHVLLCRIKLRFNPRRNRHKAEDDSFLQKLDALLDPGKVAPPQREASWAKLASEAVDDAREILKREWEVTKGRWPVSVKWANAFGLFLGMLGVIFVFLWGPPQPSFQRGVAISLEDATPLPNGETVAQHNADVAAIEKHYRMMSEVGLGLIFFGFLFQFGGALASKD